MSIPEISQLNVKAHLTSPEFLSNTNSPMNVRVAGEFHVLLGRDFAVVGELFT